jgi:hypothetical protein
MGVKIKWPEKRPSEKLLMNRWQELVKTRANFKCEYPGCQKTAYLNAHHIYSKSHRSTCFDPDNGMCLCSGCHSLNNHSAHKDPDFKDRIIESGVRSKEFYTMLERRAKSPAKLDLNLVLLDLENELKKAA